MRSGRFSGPLGRFGRPPAPSIPAASQLCPMCSRPGNRGARERVGRRELKLISEVLRQHVEGKAPKFEETLQRMVRQEIRVAG